MQLSFFFNLEVYWNLTEPDVTLWVVTTHLEAEKAKI